MVPTNPMSLRPLPIGESGGRSPLAGLDAAGRTRSDREGVRSFLETLEDKIKQVNQMQTQADQAIEDLVTGENADIAQTMIAVQKASLSFQLMAQVRNKIVQAYEEVMRMPV